MGQEQDEALDGELVTFGAYTEAWLRRRARRLAPRTTETYRWVLLVITEKRKNLAFGS